jgi:hypothetical protein
LRCVDGKLHDSFAVSSFSWNEAYFVEKKNFSEYGDVGEVWFGEDSSLRIVR